MVAFDQIDGTEQLNVFDLLRAHPSFEEDFRKRDTGETQRTGRVAQKSSHDRPNYSGQLVSINAFSDGLKILLPDYSLIDVSAWDFTSSVPPPKFRASSAVLLRASILSGGSINTPAIGTSAL